MTEVGRVSLAARAFTLAGVVSIAVLIGNDVLRGAVIVLIVGVWAQLFMLTGRLPDEWVAIVEGSTVAIFAAVLWPHNDAATPYLIVPALIGGMAGGVKGTLRVLAVEAVVTSLAWWTFVDKFDRISSARLLAWLFAGFGLGLLGTAFRRATTSSGSEASYRNALSLIKQLHALSGRLTAGLDAVSLAEQIMRTISRRVSYAQAVVLVPTASGEATPLRFSDGASSADLMACLSWASHAWEDGRALVRDHFVAIPLITDSTLVGMLVAECATAPDSRALEQLTRSLSPQVVQLHAALLFGQVRDSATSEERQRLAREVHDGVAQDVASLGYLVDNLLDGASDVAQREGLDALRSQLTRVVTELRHSVFDLRNEAGSMQGLGQGISSFARHIGSHSDLTVHVTLDEAPTRLRPEVESELLRIAQEAINNARKHSGGKNLWVTCRVRPPAATLEVRDDGAGLGDGREDSHGLTIMRERAERIGADLSVETPADADGLSGTRVTLQLPAIVNDVSERWMVRA